MAVSSKKPQRPGSARKVLKSNPSPRAASANKSRRTEATPPPLAVWQSIASTVLREAAKVSETKKRMRKKQILAAALAQWEEKLFGQGDWKGKKKALKATRQLIDAVFEGTEAVRVFVVPKKPGKTKPA